MRVAAFGYFLLVLLLYGSLLAGFVFESRVAALLAVGALLATLIGHLVVSVAEYRRTMRREWPKVEPLTDDDEWDAA